jgi:formylglycine-generating enzyme required for sulfatase activity
MLTKEQICCLLLLNSVAIIASAETTQPFEPEMVKLPIGIWMGKYEVTQKQWQEVMGSNPSAFYNPPIFKKDDFPIDNVSWNDVQIFIAQLNKKTGKTYRLPTEKEWLDACQAGEKYDYCGSNNVDEVAWIRGMPHSVGQKKPNAWGLYDMSGNVYEWTNTLSDNHKARVLCGGSWSHVPEASRVTSCPSFVPYIRYNFLGFRLARN